MLAFKETLPDLLVHLCNLVVVWTLMASSSSFSTELGTVKGQQGTNYKAWLVSVAIGAEYHESLRRLRSEAAVAGFDGYLLWTEKELVMDPLFVAQRKQWELLDLTSQFYDNVKWTGHEFSYMPNGSLMAVYEDNMRRDPDLMSYIKQHWKPGRRGRYCYAFKPLIIYRALLLCADCDYVLWADASRHVPPSINAFKIQDVLRTLNSNGDGDSFSRIRTSAAGKRGHWSDHAVPRTPTPRSMFGKIYCATETWVTDQPRWYYTNYMTAAFHDAFAPGMSREFNRVPAVLTSTVIVANTMRNKHLMHEWLEMALVKPKAFCPQRTPEESALVVLLLKYRLPVACDCLQYEQDKILEDTDKRLRVAERGMFLHNIEKKTSSALRAIVDHKIIFLDPLSWNTTLPGVHTLL